MKDRTKRITLRYDCFEAIEDFILKCKEEKKDINKELNKILEEYFKESKSE